MPGSAWSRRAIAASGPQIGVTQQPGDRRVHLRSAERVRVEPDAEARLVDALGVVVDWSQKSGSRIIGLPLWKLSVTVLLPPWVMTR